MDPETVRYVAYFFTTALISIISWIILSCCCGLVYHLYSKRDLKTIYEETQAFEMSELATSRFDKAHEMNTVWVVDTGHGPEQKQPNPECQKYLLFFPKRYR